MSRRLVSVLFLDLVGWTELAERLDPEPLQQLLERYYEICVAAVEQHEGAIEKFIGDAVMATFGAERSQEDDAVRALRTAVQIRTTTTGLRLSGKDSLQVHCGIAAGEALVHRSPRAGLRVVGDVVNLAARLQSVAPAGEILVNDVVVRLVRSRFAMERVPPLALKGKRDPVAAWRVTGPGNGTNGGWSGVGLVDRDGERRRLHEAYHSAVSSTQMRTVTVLGQSGIGKSRLVREVINDLSAGGAGPRTGFGICTSYGGTHSYAPLGPMVDMLLAQGRTPGSEALSRRVREVLSYVRHPPPADNGSTAPGVEEISWAVRGFLCVVASRPLVLVWDDLHWAGRSLLDLIIDLAAALSAHPVLMVCIGRPELRQLGLPWLREGGRANILDVGPLSPPETVELVESLEGSHVEALEVTTHDVGLVERIAAESAGNPLFAELMVETAASGHSLDEVPPSVSAMVGAMVDRLPVPSRELLEAASVVGPAFTLGHVEHLHHSPGAGIPDLEERQLVHASTNPDEYVFGRQMVHAVVYGRLTKERRLSWHRKLAENGVDPAFHWESAVRLLLDLRPDAPELYDLATGAVEALTQEGTYALRRRDLPAAVGLLERARDVAQYGSESCRAVSIVRLSDALLLSGDLQRALTVVQETADDPARPPPGLACRVQRYLVALRSGQACVVPVHELLTELRDAEHDALAWCRFEQLQMLSHVSAGRFGKAEEAADAALEHARAMSDAYEEDRLLAARCEIGQWSPTPIGGKLAGCVELAARFAGDRCLLVPVLAAQARFRALTGDLDGAWTALTEAEAAVAELQLTMGAVLVEQVAGLICSLTGESADAERHYRRAVAALTAAGHRPAALTMQVLAVRERADREISAAEELQALIPQLDQMDLRGRVLCRATEARLAISGRVLARAAEQVWHMIGALDDACLRGDACFDLARAYRRRGDHDRARDMADAALESYDSIGAGLAMRRVRAWS